MEDLGRVEAQKRGHGGYSFRFPTGNVVTGVVIRVEGGSVAAEHR